MQITIPETKITLPEPRYWKWGLLAALLVVAAVVAGHAAEPFTLSLTPQAAEAAFPGENGKIAFQTTRDVNNEIYVMNTDGSAQTNLSNNAAHDRSPVWSPDGAKVAFSSTRDGNNQIYVMNADGGGLMLLANNAAVDGRPAWSPDGTRIAFGGVGILYNDVYVMNSDGNGQTNLSDSASSDKHPNWSPDGTQIVFESDRDGNPEVYVMNVDGSGQTNLTNNAAEDGSPAWSPDGTQIAFYSTRDGNHEVYVMNADGSSQTNLTNNPALDSSPAWSPDGTQIAFTSGRDGNGEVYAMNADGSSQVNLTNHPALDTSPDWSPVPPISITKVGQYVLPKTCFEVRNTSQVPWFQVCDNDFQGAPDVSPVCIPDGTCNDEDPAPGRIKVTVPSDEYDVAEIKAPVNHRGDRTTYTCDSTFGCAFTSTAEPLNDPWFPWDLPTGVPAATDGFVGISDIGVVVAHFGEVKAAP